MSDDPRRERGKEKFQQVAQMPAFEPPDAFTAATIDQVFGDLWQRPGLGDRDRRLVTLGILAARGMEFESKTHLAGALQSGDLDVTELMEVVLQVAHYAGWPHAATFYRGLRAACGELGIEVPGPEGATEA